MRALRLLHGPLLIAVGFACGASVGTSHPGCLRQAECVIGDAVHDICMGGAECVDGWVIPCATSQDCGPFGWCDHSVALCAAEDASHCVVDGELVNCLMGARRCCEALDGSHACTEPGDCEGAILYP